MARVKTFTNGGSLLPGDLNSIEDDYEFAFSTYKDVRERSGYSGTAPAGDTYVLGTALGAATTMQGISAPVRAAETVIYFDPADYAGNTRTTKYRVRAQLFTNSVAPATNWTVGLYPVQTWSAVASGAQQAFTALGAVVVGSTVAFAAPGANTQPQGNSGDFNAPAAGYYVLAVLNSGASAANSVQSVKAELQVRQV